MTTITQYLRTVTCEFFGKSAFAGTFKIEVDASGVPVSPLNYESLSGDGISSVEYYENDNELQVNGTNDGVAVMHNFSTATEDTTYNEREPEGTWSYTAETVSFDIYDIIIGTDWTGETGGRSWLVFMKDIDETSFGATYKYSNTFDDTTGVGTLTIKEVTTLPDGVLDNNTHILSVVLPECFTTIDDGAFAGDTKLTTITFPSTVTNFGTLVFDGCTTLGKIIVNNPTPPTIDGGDLGVDDVEVDVPYGSGEAYANAAGWSDQNINDPKPAKHYGFNLSKMLDTDYVNQGGIR